MSNANDIESTGPLAFAVYEPFDKSLEYAIVANRSECDHVADISDDESNIVPLYPQGPGLDELRERLDAAECTLDDEEAAHQDTLRLLGLRNEEIANLKAELAFQRQRAYMRNDIVSADRISKLIGAKLPSVHEGEA